MNPATALAQEDQEALARKTPSGLCGILLQVARLRARFHTYALPDGLATDYSLTEDLDKIRQLYSNYVELSEELELTCLERVANGGTCSFSECLASGTDRKRCPALSLVEFTLKRVAEEELEQALIQWRRRTLRNRAEHQVARP